MSDSKVLSFLLERQALVTASGFQSWLCHLLAVLPLGNLLKPVPSFLICKVVIIVKPVSEFSTIKQGLAHVPNLRFSFWVCGRVVLPCPVFPWKSGRTHARSREVTGVSPGRSPWEPPDWTLHQAPCPRHGYGQQSRWQRLHQPGALGSLGRFVGLSKK